MATHDRQQDWSNPVLATKQKQNPFHKSSITQRAAFVGDTKDMNGHVFQIHSEQRKKNQFNDTMDVLKTYTSQKYVKHIDYLTPLFVDLLVPEIPRPVPVAKNHGRGNYA